MEPVLICTREGGVATVTLNRPASRNALSRDLRDRLRGLVAELDADETVAAIIVTGADPAFCAGVDVRELRAGGSAPEDIGPHGAPFVVSGTPLIGSINGPAYTGGLELALACHFLIASERASFADTHARLGLMPGWGLTVLLPEAVGVRRARQMSVTCEPIDAATALRWGLVNSVVAHADLGAATREVARQIGTNHAGAVRRVTQLYDAQATVRQASAWELESSSWVGTAPVDTPDQPNAW